MLDYCINRQYLLSLKKEWDINGHKTRKYIHQSGENYFTLVATVQKAPKPRRFKIFWTAALYLKAETRSELYKIAEHTSREGDLLRYNDLSRDVKREAKQSGTASYRHFMEEMHNKVAS